MYGIFGIVLGLLAWIYLAVQVTVYAAEINVVLARRLWPRSIVQPPLTEADRASMALQALQNQRRPEQHVEVTFDDRAPSAPEPVLTPRTPDEVAPPADMPAAEVPSDAEVPPDDVPAGVRVPEPRPGAESAARPDRAQ